MRIAVVGGGPAGLFFAYLWKKRHPDAKVRVFEQNPADVTWGFGVVFSDRALDFLRADAPEIIDVIVPHMESWQNMAIETKGQCVEIDGVGFSAIGRLALLQLLQGQACAVGAELIFGEPVSAVEELGDADLIVAADGINSVVRRVFEGDFKTSLSYGDNKFVWFGTTRRFEALSQTFVETDRGTFNAHHYRYARTEHSDRSATCRRPGCAAGPTLTIRHSANGVRGGLCVGANPDHQLIPASRCGATP